MEERREQAGLVLINKGVFLHSRAADTRGRSAPAPRSPTNSGLPKPTKPRNATWETPGSWGGLQPPPTAEDRLGPHRQSCLSERLPDRAGASEARESLPTTSRGAS